MSAFRWYLELHLPLLALGLLCWFSLTLHRKTRARELSLACIAFGASALGLLIQQTVPLRMSLGVLSFESQARNELHGDISAIAGPLTTYGLFAGTLLLTLFAHRIHGLRWPARPEDPSASARQ